MDDMVKMADLMPGRCVADVLAKVYEHHASIEKNFKALPGAVRDALKPGKEQFDKKFPVSNAASDCWNTEFMAHRADVKHIVEMIALKDDDLSLDNSVKDVLLVTGPRCHKLLQLSTGVKGQIDYDHFLALAKAICDSIGHHEQRHLIPTLHRSRCELGSSKKLSKPEIAQFLDKPMRVMVSAWATLATSIGNNPEDMDLKELKFVLPDVADSVWHKFAAWVFAYHEKAPLAAPNRYPPSNKNSNSNVRQCRV